MSDFYMEPSTGTVQSIEDWKDDSMDWGLSISVSEEDDDGFIVDEEICTTLREAIEDMDDELIELCRIEIKRQLNELIKVEMVNGEWEEVE